MTITSEIIEAARSVGPQHAIAPAVLLAVAIVETNAVAFAAVADRREPLVRFEGHYFDRLLPGDARKRARAAGLAHPRAGAVRNPASQAARWALLARAAQIDEAAAYASTSWGLGQVMGAHWQALGYADPLALAAAARRSAEGQFELAARFLKLGGLHALLERGDQRGFARRYNGPGFARNRYDEKIAAAHARAHRLLSGPGADGGAGGPNRARLGI